MSIFSSAGWANSVTGQKMPACLSVCVCVCVCVLTRVLLTITATRRLTILHEDLGIFPGCSLDIPSSHFLPHTSLDIPHLEKFPQKIFPLDNSLLGIPRHFVPYISPIPDPNSYSSQLSFTAHGLLITL